MPSYDSEFIEKCRSLVSSNPHQVLNKVILLSLTMSYLPKSITQRRHLSAVELNIRHLWRPFKDLTDVTCHKGAA